MNLLVIGLGSMGKRRIRCLQALGVANIAGFDPREDRCLEANKAYQVQCFTDFKQAWNTVTPSAVIISVPPDVHIPYMKQCVEASVPFFVEASVISDGLAEIEQAAAKKSLVAAPSTTLWFHAGIQKIKSVIESGRLGKISNVMLHSGQYLPDWHTYERVEDYYVSNPLTGGAREIVPFELTWLTAIFGLPKRVAANVRKTISIAGAERIDDTYNCLLDYGDFLTTLTVDVVSRFATRRLVINGSQMQLVWAWEDNAVRLFDPARNAWEVEPYSVGAAAPGYNANIGEQMYIGEVQAFLDAVGGKAAFPNSLKEDMAVLALLEKLEASDRESRFIQV